MKLSLKGTKTSITPAIRDYVTAKVETLERFIHPKTDQEILAEVEVGLRSRHHKKGDIYRAEINLTIDGELYRAVSVKPDLNEAIDEMRHEIEKQVRRGGSKKTSLFRRGAKRAKEILQRLR